MIKQVLITAVAIIVTLISLSAKDSDYLYLGDISKHSNGWEAILIQDSVEHGEASELDKLPRYAKVKMTARSEEKFKDVTVEQAGTLASLLGEEINDIDSLVVRGKVNAEDLYAMWSSSFYGVLSVLNLEYAEIVGNRLPDDAFWHQSEQYTPGDEYIYCIHLRRIILPEGLEGIGVGAFGYAINLEDINFPSTLRKIAERCFSDCIRLNVDPLVFPEGMEEIGYMAFVNCKALTGRVVLPSTMKKINGGVFFSTKITECNFPDGLEEIGDAAFYATRLKEVILPNSCQSLTGTDHFALNYELEKVRFPEGVTKIPGSFVYNCIKLTEFNIPNSVMEIGSRAFWQCGLLKDMSLPTNLKSIGLYGLYSCRSLKTVNFSSSLETIGAESCKYWVGIESIYCAAPIPPTCIKSNINVGCTPFGRYGDGFVGCTPQDTPVYVPIGSADLYRSAWGWDYFTNIIETDDFPFAGVAEVSVDKAGQDAAFYDLQGRRVAQPVEGRLYIRSGKVMLYQ